MLDVFLTGVNHTLLVRYGNKLVIVVHSTLLLVDNFFQSRPKICQSGFVGRNVIFLHHVYVVASNLILMLLTNWRAQFLERLLWLVAFPLHFDHISDLVLCDLVSFHTQGAQIGLGPLIFLYVSEKVADLDGHHLTFVREAADTCSVLSLIHGVLPSKQLSSTGYHDSNLSISIVPYFVVSYGVFWIVLISLLRLLTMVLRFEFQVVLRTQVC